MSTHHVSHPHFLNISFDWNSLSRGRNKDIISIKMMNSLLRICFMYHNLEFPKSYLAC